MLRERTATKEAQHVTDVANAVMRARSYDPTRTAIGLAVVATIIAGDDPQVKTVLAITMLKMSKELDPDVVENCGRWQ
jgi:hypothetical protein